MGALVGAVAAIAGTVVTQRTATQRIHRADMYFNLMPKWRQTQRNTNGDLSALRRQTEKVLRTATAAGKHDRDHARLVCRHVKASDCASAAKEMENFEQWLVGHLDRWV
jgi:hypothetical protein